MPENQVPIQSQVPLASHEPAGSPFTVMGAWHPRCPLAALPGGVGKSTCGSISSNKVT